MATIINNRSSLATDPLRNFRFLVTFLPHTYTPATGTTAAADVLGTAATMGFTSVSGLSVSAESIPYREGGYNTTVHQIPGQTTFAPISLQRGMMLGSTENWNRMRQLFATVNGGAAGTIENDFRFDLEIQVLSHPVAGAGSEDGSSTTDHTAIRFHVYNCWITSLAYSDLNAGDNAILVEQINLVHEGFDARYAADLKSSASTF